MPEALTRWQRSIFPESASENLRVRKSVNKNEAFTKNYSRPTSPVWFGGSAIRCRDRAFA